MTEQKIRVEELEINFLLTKKDLYKAFDCAELHQVRVIIEAGRKNLLARITSGLDYALERLPVEDS